MRLACPQCKSPTTSAPTQRPSHAPSRPEPTTKDRRQFALETTTRPMEEGVVVRFYCRLSPRAKKERKRAEQACSTRSPATYHHVVCFDLPLLSRITALLTDWRDLLQTYTWPSARIISELEWDQDTCWQDVADRYKQFVAGTGTELLYINWQHFDTDSGWQDDPIWNIRMYSNSFASLAHQLECAPNPSADRSSRGWMSPPRPVSYICRYALLNHLFSKSSPEA